MLVENGLEGMADTMATMLNEAMKIERSAAWLRYRLQAEAPVVQGRGAQSLGTSGRSLLGCRRRRYF